MRNILLVLFIFWLLFLNGFSQIKQWSGSAALTTAPQTILTGAQRAVQRGGASTPQSQVRIIGGASSGPARSVSQVAQSALPTATLEPTAEPTIAPTPEPPTATPVIVVPQGLPEAAQMPTDAPLPTVEPPRYPSADQQYAVHTVNDKGYPQDCVYIYSQNKRVCWAPGVHPDESNVKWTVGMAEAGNIAGEPLP